MPPSTLAPLPRKAPVPKPSQRHERSGHLSAGVRIGVFGLGLLLTVCPALAQDPGSGDVDGNDKVDAGDLAAFAQAWREYVAGRPDWNRRADLAIPYDHLDWRDAQALLAVWLSLTNVSPADLLAEAEQDVDAGRITDAEEKLQRVMATKPDWARPHGVLGVVRQEQGNQSAATAEYELFGKLWRRKAGVAESPQAAYEARFYWLINDERFGRAISLLKPNPGLCHVALWHSDYMLKTHTLTHEEEDARYKLPWDRMATIMGCRPSYAAENVGNRWGEGTVVITIEWVDVLHQAFMDSPGHRANILDTRGADIGVALSLQTSARKELWVTENLAKMAAGGACPGAEPAGDPAVLQRLSGPLTLGPVR